MFLGKISRMDEKKPNGSPVYDSKSTVRGTRDGRHVDFLSVPPKKRRDG